MNLSYKNVILLLLAQNLNAIPWNWKVQELVSEPIKRGMEFIW